MDTHRIAPNVDTHRIVDIGCGPGWLSRLAVTLGYSYLGVDPAAAKAKAVSGGRIEPLDADAVREKLRPADIVVLNGVAHHLDDTTLGGVLGAARRTTALLICDHRSEPANHALNRLLQRYDRGKYIRPVTHFFRLQGYDTMHLDRFNITWLGLPIWAYFTGLYRPTRSEP